MNQDSPSNKARTTLDSKAASAPARTNSNDDGCRAETTSTPDGKPVTDALPAETREFHICALGASAGGLDPLQKFFASVPQDLGVAYVVIQHLSPDHDSKMPQLLERHTNMPVRLVIDSHNGEVVEPNYVYLIPPAKQMVIQNGRLFLSDRANNEQLTLPIDQFLLSLAQDQGRFSIGIILSGTGGDGSSGITDISRAGGLVMVQDPRSAKFDSMPERSLATGLCDVVLPPEGLADALACYVSQSLSREQIDQLELTGSRGPAGSKILDALREHSHIDFLAYKPRTVLRRIQRRQELMGFNTLSTYGEAVEKDPDERDRLMKDLLIGVTKFYRNREAFEVLQHEALTKILVGKRANDEVRIWVAGCATGEEAYSIAFMLDEAIERLDREIRFKLFATDAFQPAVDKAALGIFDAQSIAVLPQDKLDKYFVQTKEAFQVIPRIRQQIVFVQHDLMKDAPFTRMDLVTCRNLLIYLQPPAQAKCLSLFHFALSAGGFLFLGSSESVGVLEEEFEPINKTWRLFRKLRDVQRATNKAEATRRAMTAAHTIGEQFTAAVPAGNGSPAFRLADSDLQRVYDRLLENTLPAGFLIDSQDRLLHTFAGGSDFMEVGTGRHSDHLTDLIHKDLRPSLGAAIQHCRRDRKKVIYAGITAKLRPDRASRSFDLVLEPIESKSSGRELPILVTVIEVDSQPTESSEATRVDVSNQSQDSLRSLENELTFTRENLQATIQELESSNEELQATNEEMVASNEELQSTNEELQSVNEELHTVNAEYHRKIAQLQNANDDMDNLLSSSNVAVLFLDESLKIRRFTPNLASLFGLRSQDAGRCITSFQTSFVPQRLMDKFREVLIERKTLSDEIEHPDGRLFLVRITPFDSSTITDGVVVNYVDMTELREKEDAAGRWASIIRSTADCIIAIDMSGLITQWNPAAEQVYGWPESEAIGKNLFDLIVPRNERAAMAGRIEQVRSDQVGTQFDSVRITRDGQPLEVMARLSPVFGVHGIAGISSVERDVTMERRQSRLRVFEESVRSNFFAQRTGGNGLQQLATVAMQTFGARSLWVWHVDSLNGDLSADSSSFGEGESAWLSDNEINLRELVLRSLESQNPTQLDIEVPPPPRLELTTSDEKSEPIKESTNNSTRWRLLLKPLVYKEQSLGAIAVLVDATSNEHYEEIRSTIDTVAHLLAIQIADENHYEELLRISAIVENASDFVGTCDASGRLVSINRAGRLMTGIGLDDDVALLAINDLHPPESLEVILTIGMPEASRTGHWTGPTELIDRKGNRLPVSQLMTSHRDDSGRLRYFSTICRVMSEQQGIQTRLEKLIRQAQTDSDAKANFVAHVSHDVRTPMNSVIGLAELLLEQNLEPDQQSMIQSIRDNSVSVTQLLNDLLDLSRVESGKLTIAPTPVDIAQILREVKQAFQPVAEQAGLELTMDVSGLPDEPLSLDPTRFRQIIEKLLSNAIRFTETGFVKVTTSSDSENFAIEVTDSGRGIANSMLATVFDPYKQSSLSSPRGIGGAGLGLAIGRKLAERMDGELQVTSQDGEGSRFTLRLPMRLATSERPHSV